MSKKFALPEFKIQAFQSQHDFSDRLSIKKNSEIQKPVTHMKHFLPLLIFTSLFATSCSIFKKKAEPAPVMHSARSGADRNRTYADQFNAAAVMESQRGGVPASIILAQGILESGAGTSELAQNANNHFGIKCGSNWSGKTYKKKDDDKDSEGNLIESCFRKYNKVEESYLDHTAFLNDPKKEYRYGFLFKLDRADYKGWAHGLEASGYSTSNTYAEKLIDIIERYQLYEYDLPDGGKPGKVPNPVDPNAGVGTDADEPLPNAKNRVGRVNDVKVVLAREGETLTDIAKAYRLSPAKVVEYNDRGFTPIQKLKANTRVYIETKKDKPSGTASEHTVKSNETMFQISQMYGIKLDKLLKRNRLIPGEEPAVGERIRLKTTRPKNDNVRLRDSNVEDPAPSQPNEYWPTTPPSNSMEPDEDGYLEEIPGGGGQVKQDTPQPTNPPATTPPVVTKPPATSGSTYPPTPPPTTTPNQPKPPVVQDGYHLVVKGDTLFSISRKYNTSVAKIKQLNNMTSDTVKIGQTLRVK